jgi:hypothetical protein
MADRAEVDHEHRCTVALEHRPELPCRCACGAVREDGEPPWVEPAPARCHWCDGEASTWAIYDTIVGAFQVDVCEHCAEEPHSLDVPTAVDLVLSRPPRGTAEPHNDPAVPIIPTPTQPEGRGRRER